MLLFLQQLSGVAFYLLGGSFFLGYLFLQNDLWPREMAYWMQVADLPLVLTALLYGGISFYRSVRDPKKTSKLLPIVVSLILVALFAAIVVFNFRAT